jgi:hypothetical protein
VRVDEECTFTAIEVSFTENIAQSVDARTISKSRQLSTKKFCTLVHSVLFVGWKLGEFS